MSKSYCTVCGAKLTKYGCEYCDADFVVSPPEYKPKEVLVRPYRRIVRRETAEQDETFNLMSSLPQILFAILVALNIVAITLLQEAYVFRTVVVALRLVLSSYLLAVNVTQDKNELDYTVWLVNVVVAGVELAFTT